jgi:glutathione synthase
MLIGDPDRARNDNHRRLPEGFERAGWEVAVVDHDQLGIQGNRVVAGKRPIEEFDLIWPLGFGRQVTFFDRMQMLASLPTSTFVTSPRVLLELHGKHRWLDLMPETHTSTRPELLTAAVDRGGDWVVKPTAGSYGRDVQLIRAGENGRRLIETLSRELDGAYLMVQRYIPEIRDGEKRSLIAGGKIIASYLRRPEPAEGGLKSNLAAGGSPEATALTQDEVDLIAPIARELAGLGAGYAAIDTVYPYLMEINIANPGGLETVEHLGGVDVTDLVVQSIVAWAAARHAGGTAPTSL